jgi:hypothetical protein
LHRAIFGRVQKKSLRIFCAWIADGISALHTCARETFQQSNHCLARAVAPARRDDLNFLRCFRTIDKFVLSLPVRLDETLPKLVEFTH